MNTPEYQNFQEEYDRKLIDYQPVEMVYQAEQARENMGGDKFDTVFHHFMYDYVGSITDASQAPLMLKEHENIGVLNYPNRMYAGFTDSGKFMLVRCSSDIPMDRPEQFYIATADVTTEQVSTWSVTELMARDRFGFECYMENQDGDEAHLILGTQKIELLLAGMRRPERVAALDKTFMDLLEYRRRLQDAPNVGKLLMFMANPTSLQLESEPVTIAA